MSCESRQKARDSAQIIDPLIKQTDIPRVLSQLVRVTLRPKLPNRVLLALFKLWIRSWKLKFSTLIRSMTLVPCGSHSRVRLINDCLLRLISFTEVPFVHESIPFGPSSYYKWRPKRNSSIKGSLRLGLKLSKQKTAIRRVVHVLPGFPSLSLLICFLFFLYRENGVGRRQADVWTIRVGSITRNISCQCRFLPSWLLNWEVRWGKKTI